MFPTESSHLRRAGAFQLVYQGLSLHFASFWGPLRTSRVQRTEDRRWLIHALARWVQEYGGNVGLLLMFQLLIASSPGLASHWFLASVTSLAVPPLLSVFQMLLDNHRSDSRVFFDPETCTGMTVKAYRDENGNLVWSYFNHFALPIGAKNGRGIRAEVHRQGKLRSAVVTCNAQNELIANFYLRDNPAGENMGGKRPLMVWNYSGMQWKERKSSLLATLFGVYSTRNSGQMPLGGKRLKLSAA